MTFQPICIAPPQHADIEEKHSQERDIHILWQPFAFQAQRHAEEADADKNIPCFRARKQQMNPVHEHFSPEQRKQEPKRPQPRMRVYANP